MQHYDALPSQTQLALTNTSLPSTISSLFSSLCRSFKYVDKILGFFFPTAPTRYSLHGMHLLWAQPTSFLSLPSYILLCFAEMQTEKGETNTAGHGSKMCTYIIILPLYSLPSPCVLRSNKSSFIILQWNHPWRRILSKNSWLITPAGTGHQTVPLSDKPAEPNTNKVQLRISPRFTASRARRSAQHSKDIPAEFWVQLHFWSS